MDEIDSLFQPAGERQTEIARFVVKRGGRRDETVSLRDDRRHFCCDGLVCVGYMTVKLGKVSLFEKDTYSLYARFSSVTGLRVGNPSRCSESKSGANRKAGDRPEGSVALVEIRLKDGIQVYGDAIASIKTSGLIGDRYVSIDPGGPKPC